MRVVFSCTLLEEESGLVGVCEISNKAINSYINLKMKINFLILSCSTKVGKNPENIKRCFHTSKVLCFHQLTNLQVQLQLSWKIQPVSLDKKDSEWKCLLDIIPKNKNNFQVHQPGKNTILSITYWKYKARSVAMIACSTSLITLL